MNHLLQSQIKESCKLSLPEGLTDLMSDISREVLRAQPQNLYQFIANYLEALIETREALTIACHICKDICECDCEEHLGNDLRKIGLNDQDVEDAVEIIVEHFNCGTVKEQNILLKLMKKTSINVDQVVAVQKTIQRAFQRSLLKNSEINENLERKSDDVLKAVHHTIMFYEHSKTEKDVIPSEQQENYIKSELTAAGSYGINQSVGFKEEYTSGLPEKSIASDRNTLSSNSVIGKDFIAINNNTSVDCNKGNLVETDSVDSFNSNTEDVEEDLYGNKEHSLNSSVESIPSLDSNEF